MKRLKSEGKGKGRRLNEKGLKRRMSKGRKRRRRGERKGKDEV